MLSVENKSFLAVPSQLAEVDPGSLRTGACSACVSFSFQRGTEMTLKPCPLQMGIAVNACDLST